MATSKLTINEMSSSQDEAAQPTVPKLSDRYADESYKLLSQVKVDPPTPDEAEQIRKKCVRWVIPFICVGYHLMYVDKQTVSKPVTPSFGESHCTKNSHLLMTAGKLFHTRDIR